jgi:predicted nucleotidyltransferase
MINNELIKMVALGLKDLIDDIVFVGGAFVNLYSTDIASRKLRYTDDIDCVIESIHLSDFNKFEERIRKSGFKNDISEGAPICRYVYKGIKVDFLPTEGDILGFRNRWYPDGFKNAIPYKLQEEIKIKIFNSVYFLASKLDAFWDRGRADFRLSTDFEDIVFLLDSRDELINEIKDSELSVKKYILDKFRYLLEHSDLDEGIIAVVERDTGMERINLIKNKIREIASIEL